MWSGTTASRGYDRLMRALRFAIATEQHARQFGALMKASRSWEAYVEQSSPRIAGIKAEFRRLGIDKKVKYLHFNDCLAGDRNEVLVLPLYMSRKRQHIRYRSMPGFKDFLARDLDKMRRRVVLMNEDFYYGPGDYYPHVHRTLARSQLEYELLQGRCGSPNTTVGLVGDAALDADGYNPSYKPRKRALGIFTAGDTGLRKRHARHVVKTILDDLNRCYEDLDITSVVHKPHPGDTGGPHWEMIQDWAVKKKLRFVCEKRMKELGIFYNLDIACVQDSWTSHTHLRKNGVLSFYYMTDQQQGWELEFHRKAGHPPCRVHADPGDAYDAWVKETFLLDGNTGRRFNECVGDLR